MPDPIGPQCQCQSGPCSLRVCSQWMGTCVSMDDFFLPSQPGGGGWQGLGQWLFVDPDL